MLPKTLFCPPKALFKTAGKPFFSHFLKYYLHYSYLAKKYQHFNKKKTRENLLSERT
jgi:hypothetical protein